MAKSDFMIKGEPQERIYLDNLLTNDEAAGIRFDYMLCKRWLSLVIRNNGVREYALAAYPLNNSSSSQSTQLFMARSRCSSRFPSLVYTLFDGHKQGGQKMCSGVRRLIIRTGESIPGGPAVLTL